MLLPIDQATAIQVFNPALTEAIIPTGTYQGYPPIPATDLKTVAVQRLLFAQSTLNRSVVQKITQEAFRTFNEVYRSVREVIQQQS